MSKLHLQIKPQDILSAAACVGVIGTGVTSYLAGKKNEKEPSWLNYILPGVCGAGTIAAIVLPHRAARFEIAGLAATAGYLATQRDALLKKEDGESIVQDKSSIDIPAAEWTGKGDQLCLEGYFGRWFYSSEEEVKKAVTEFTAEFNEYEYNSCPYNDLYSKLGIQETHIGWDFGYNNTEGGWHGEIEFKCEYADIKGRRVYVIEPAGNSSYPVEGWWEV